MSNWRAWAVAVALVMSAALASANFVDAATRAEKWYLPDGAIRLGLDLQGGHHLVLQVEHDAEASPEQRADSLHQALMVIRDRVTDPATGIAEAIVTSAGDDRIIVEVPGGDSREKVGDIVEPIGLLEFKIVLDKAESRADLLKKYGGQLPAGTEIVLQHTLQHTR